MSQAQPQKRGRGAPAVRIVDAPGEWALAEPLESAERCAECEGTGRRIVERDGAVVVQPCTCQDAREACRLFNAARIPRILGRKHLEPRDAHDAGDGGFALGNNPSLRHAYAVVTGFVHRFGEGRGDHSAFVLMGPPGVGKSHLLAGTLRSLTLQHRARCRYVEFFHLLSELKEGYSQGKSDQEIIAPLCEVDVLAVDELAKGRGTAWEMYVLDELISRRYNAGKTTLFASNYTQQESTTFEQRLARTGAYQRTGSRDWADEVVAETLEQRVGQRIYSRLCEMCEMVEIQGDDWRRRVPS